MVHLIINISIRKSLTRHLWSANKRASAAMVFSPPDIWSMAQKRLPGGITE
jgi:hypothetical protein